MLRTEPSAFSVFVYLCVKWRGDQAVAHDWSTLQCFDVCCLQAEECWSFNPALKHLYRALWLLSEPSKDIWRAGSSNPDLSAYDRQGALESYVPLLLKERGLVSLKNCPYMWMHWLLKLVCGSNVRSRDKTFAGCVRCRFSCSFKDGGALNGNISANLKTTDEPGCPLMRAGEIVWAPSC